MARPVKETQKEQILEAYREMSLLYPLGDVNLRKNVAEKLHLPLRTVQYYLQGAADARKKYTPEDCRFLKTATRQEIIRWAGIHGKRPESVYTFAHRLRGAADAPPKEGTRTRQRMQEQGYFDFSSSTDLALFGLKPAQFKAANEILYKKGLALGAPNYFIHPATSRYYTLTLAEQCALLSSPATFLSDKNILQRIGAGWKSGAGMLHLVLVQFPGDNYSHVAFTSSHVEPAGKFMAEAHRLLPFVSWSLADRLKPGPGERPFMVGDLFETPSAPPGRSESTPAATKHVPEAADLDLDTFFKNKVPAVTKDKYYAFRNSLDPDGEFRALAPTLHAASLIACSGLKGVTDTISFFHYVEAHGGTLEIFQEFDGRLITKADLVHIPAAKDRMGGEVPEHWIIREAPKNWTFVTMIGDETRVPGLNYVEAWRRYAKNSMASEHELTTLCPDLLTILDGEFVVWTRR